MRWIFCWLLRGAISHPTLQSTFVVIASGDTTYQGTLVVVISRSTALIAVILWWTAWKIWLLLRPCVSRWSNHCCCTPAVRLLPATSKIVMSSRFCDERHALSCDYAKNMLVAVASYDTTCKIYFSSLLLLQMTIKLFEIVRSSRYDVHWLALRDTTWSSLARSLAIRWKMSYCCLLVAIQHKNKLIVRHRSQCYGSSSHRRDVTAKNVYVIASCDVT
jgi:hypothetical protein